MTTPETGTSPAAAANGTTVQHDLLCLRCGYNLRTLSINSVCPECAAPVRDSLRREAELNRLYQGDSKKHIACLVGVGILLSGLLFCWVWCFLLSVSMLTHNAMLCPKSKPIPPFAMFIVYGLERDWLALHLATAGTLLAVALFLKHRDLALCVAQTLSVFLFLGLSTLVVLWFSILDNVPPTLTSGVPDPWWVIPLVNIGCLGGALVLCVLYCLIRSRVALWLLLVFPCASLVPAFLTAEVYAGYESGYYTNLHLTLEGCCLILLVVIACAVALPLALSGGRFKLSAYIGASPWLAGLAGLVFTQLGFGFILSPFVIGLHVVGGYTGREFNLLIHAVLVMSEVGMIYWIMRAKRTRGYPFGT